MEGATIADAFQTMKDEYGVPDPRGDAYPIIVSPVDPYPANPDSEQTVYCEWTLFGNAEPVDITGFSLAETSLEMYVGRGGSRVVKHLDAMAAYATAFPTMPTITNSFGPAPTNPLQPSAATSAGRP